MLRRYDVSHPPPFKTVISFFFFHGWGGHPFAAGVGRSRGGREGRKRKREESKSCLKGFTQRVSADCLQLPSAPPVVSLATVFPNLSAASLPPSLPRSLAPSPPPLRHHKHTLLMRLRNASPLFPGGHLRSCSARGDRTVSECMCPSGTAASVSL